MQETAPNTVFEALKVYVALLALFVMLCPEGAASTQATRVASSYAVHSVLFA